MPAGSVRYDTDVVLVEPRLLALRMAAGSCYARCPRPLLTKHYFLNKKHCFLNKKSLTTPLHNKTMREKHED